MELLFSQNSFAQGSLTPPGAPAATMKSLDQIEPRTSIDAAHTPGDAGTLFIISQPGSYYLTTNITGAAGKNGIRIAASGVTLDLMGFEMAGVASSFAGVYVSGSRTNIAIRNGTVRSWGGDGVDAINANNGQYQDLRLSANAVGLSCGPNSNVVNCTAQGNGSNGFYLAGDGSTINGCTAQSNTGHGVSTGVGSTVTGCSARSNSLHGFNLAAANTVNGCAASNNVKTGINVGDGSTVDGCTAYSNQLGGISVGVGSTVKDCTAYLNAGSGIKLGDGCTASGCTARSNSQTGIYTAFDCTVTSCTVRRNDGSGITADTGSTVSECSVGFNGVHGIVVTSDCQVRHNNCRQNNRLNSDVGAGIYVAFSRNRIDDNNMTGNRDGIQLASGSTNNIVIRNTASANTNAYSIVVDNAVANRENVTGDYYFESTHPWANFTY